jgi:hypothetical protein
MDERMKKIDASSPDFYKKVDKLLDQTILSVEKETDYELEERGK